MLYIYKFELHRGTHRKQNEKCIYDDILLKFVFIFCLFQMNLTVNLFAVSTGGTGGLFLGASLLSFVELFYILMVRPFCDVYSKLGDDPWYKKYGNRRLEDNQFNPKRHKHVQHIRK